MIRFRRPTRTVTSAAAFLAIGLTAGAHGDFTHFSTTRVATGGLVKYTLYGNFDGPTDTVLNAFNCALDSGPNVQFHHNDALNGGTDSTVTGTWNPQFVLVSGAMDSYVCIGGGEGFASGNSTTADPGWNAAGFNQTQIPYGDGVTNGPGWYNQNPPNFQGRVGVGENPAGQVRLGQFVIALDDDRVQTVLRITLGYNNGIPGSSVQFANATFALGGDCNGNGVLDSEELASGTVADCNGNGLIDACEIADGLLVDCDANGIPDRCEGVVVVAESSPLLAPFGNGFPVSYTFSGLPTASGAEPRLHIDAISDLDLSSEFISMSVDGGAQQFYFVNGGSDCPATPDRATRTFTVPEFNALAADGSITVSLVASGTVSATQCAGGGITLRLEYDGIEAGYDCNLNGILDSCELADGTAFDCNGNGVLDACDVAAGLGTDCNGNGRLDSCDLASGESSDLNHNGIPDECSGEWIVGGSGYATIQAAIDEAPTGTTIRVGPGDYAGSALIEGKRITLTTTDGFLRTTLRGTGIDASIITIRGPEAAGSIVDRFTLRDGTAGSVFGTFRVGGAISVISAPSVSIRNCVFVDNATEYGGGVYCFGGSGQINDCYFTGNGASVDGGAIEIGGQGSWMVQRCTMVGNTAGIGGAMHLWSSSASIIDCTITDNSASNTGGAISWYSVDSGGTLLDGCSINRNTSPSGGALAVVAGTGAFDLIDTRFCLNAPANYTGSIVDSGGNIFGEDCDGNGLCNDAEIRDTASTSFVWSESEGGNGHRYLHLATPMTWEEARAYAEALGGHLATITSAEEQAAIVANFAGLNLWLGGLQSADGTEPDGGWGWVTGEAWDFTAWKAGEPNDQFGEDRLNLLPSGGWNDSGCPWACYYRIGALVEFSATAFNGNRDCNANGIPDACDIADGTDGDCDGDGVPDSCQIASGAESDCDGNGVPDSCELASGTAFDCDANGSLDVCDVAMGMGTDCNGNGKLDSCDLASGASTDLNSNGVLDECAGEFIVGGSGFRNIQAAIDAAPSGTTILVGPGTHSGGITLTSKAVVLRSIAGAANTTLSGAGLDRSILILRTAATEGSVIDGFRFTGGIVGTAEFNTRLGGAILVTDTTANIVNCTFDGNAANFGGAIYCYRYSGVIADCSFSGNTALEDGGAIQFGFGGSVEFRNNTLTSNTAGRNGGALQVVYWFDGPVTAGLIDQCSFSGNSAAIAGGALSWYAGSGGDLIASNCVVEGNTDTVAAFAKLASSPNTEIAFAISDSRFCLNTPANTYGPVQASGSNTFSQDCNANGVCDADEIAAGTETDCNGNGIPDSCELAGTVRAFGDNTFGQIVLPAGLGQVVQLAAGCDHGVVLRRDGSVVAWGHDAFGQATVPADLGPVQAIVAGCDHNLVLRQDGTVTAWGYNAFGQCDVPAINGTVVQLAAGVNQSGVRLADGSLILWGRNTDGECNVPPSFGAATGFAMGGAHTAGLRADGTVICWGLNNFGQCTVPANVGTLQAVTAGCYHTVGLRTDGTVAAWGSNIFNQTFVPPGLNGVVAIAAGSGQHTLALKADGTVVAWGWNAFGQCLVPAEAVDTVRIAAGGTHSYVLAAGAPDCNADGILDECQIASGAESDCNGNGVLDSCELASGLGADCNANGVLDDCEIAGGTASDCNGNLIPDSCDLADGTSTDLNGSGVPDDCEFVVGGSGYASIQSAVDAAPQGAVIQVAAGQWAPFSINGRAMTVESLDGAEATFVDGGGSARAVSMENIAPRAVVLRGFTIQNGSASTGAGLRLASASPTIDACIITGNIATGDGGGVACTSGAPLFTNCTITANSAQRGGGVYIGGSAVLGYAQFDGCTIEFNSAAGAGGGAVNEAALLLTQCVVVGNDAGGNGGGLATIGSAPISAVGNSYFCLNTPSNTSGPFSDLEGNVFGLDCNSNGVCDLDEIAGGAEDKNQNGELDSCELARGDLNLDGIINGADLSILLNFWGAMNPPVGDLNGDGTIGGADLSTLLNNWGS